MSFQGLKGVYTMEKYKRFEVGKTYEAFNTTECMTWASPLVCIKKTKCFAWFKDYDFLSGEATIILKRKIREGYGCEHVDLFDDVIVWAH